MCASEENMKGKKFVVFFVVTTALIGICVAVWIKQAYDTRPQVEITPEQ